MRLSSTLTFLLLTATAWATEPCRDLGKEVIDQGCDEDYPTCVYRNGGQVVGGNVGHHCALCINSRQPNHRDQVAPDEGCDEVNRVCVGKRQLASNVEGTACAVCFNSIVAVLDPRDVDDGCPPTKPVCVDDTGNSPAIWTPGTNCVAKCVDSSPNKKDNGCPPNYPVCILSDGSDPGQGNAGVECAICSPVSCDDNDPCTDDFCDPVFGCFHEDNGSCSCGEAVDWACDSFPAPLCEQYVPNDDFYVCVCDVDTEGNPFCWRNEFCSNVAPCTSSDECGPNQKCVSTCCGAGQCFDDCALTEEPLNTLRRPASTGPTGAGL